jgi:hypothetical protein
MNTLKLFNPRNKYIIKINPNEAYKLESALDKSQHNWENLTMTLFKFMNGKSYVIDCYITDTQYKWIINYLASEK